MGRAPCCDKANVKRGPWSPEEDSILRSYLEKNGNGGNWIALPHKAGLNRCGKSCRLRWLNYLRPDIKLGGFTEEEENIICALYSSIGSRWSVIASHLPGRTDNDIKNYWNTKLKKKLSAGKVSLKSSDNSNNINDLTANDISQSRINSTQISASNSIGEVETFYSGSSTSLDGIASSCTLPDVMDSIIYSQNLDPQKATLESLSQVAFPGLMEVNSDCSKSANNNYSSLSSSVQDQSSSLSISYPANVEEGSLLDLGFESSYQLLNEFDFEKATSGVAPDLLTYYPFTN